MELVIEVGKKKLKKIAKILEAQYPVKLSYNGLEIEDDYECEEIAHTIASRFGIEAFCR